MKFLRFMGALTWCATHDPDFRYWQAVKVKFYRKKWVNYDPYSGRAEFAGNFGIHYSVSKTKTKTKTTSPSNHEHRTITRIRVMVHYFLRT